MDPDANLRELLALANATIAEADGDDDMDPLKVADARDRMAELLLSLDQWLVRKGALPNRWTR